jgi:hypothetical protein
MTYSPAPSQQAIVHETKRKAEQVAGRSRYGGFRGLT